MENEKDEKKREKMKNEKEKRKMKNGKEKKKKWKKEKKKRKDKKIQIEMKPCKILMTTLSLAVDWQAIFYSLSLFSNGDWTPLQRSSPPENKWSQSLPPPSLPGFTSESISWCGHECFWVKTQNLTRFLLYQKSTGLFSSVKVLLIDLTANVCVR